MVSVSYSELQREQEEAAAEAEDATGVRYQKPHRMTLRSTALSGKLEELTPLSPLVQLNMKDKQVGPGGDQNLW